MALQACFAVVTILLSGVILIVYIVKMRFTGKGKLAPVSANIFSVMLNFNRIHDYIADVHKQYRTTRVIYPTFDYVITADPANIEHVVKSKFSNYEKGKFTQDILGDILGDGIFTVDGELWKEQRKTACLEFTAKVLRDCTYHIFRDNAAKLCRIFMAASADKETIEMQNLFLKSTMDAIGRVGFGIDLDLLSNIHTPANSFAKAFDESNSMVMWRFLNPFWKVKRYFNVGKEAKLKRTIEIVNSFLYPIIQQRKQEILKQKASEKSDILSRFITLDNEKSFNDKFLRDILLSFLIAGRDTTAVSLCWFFHCLFKNPNVESKLLQEIRSFIKIDVHESFEESLCTFLENLKLSVIEKMHYLHAALSETLRLYPALPLECKTAVSDDILPEGYRVRKGDSILYSPYAMGRMTYLWGPDAEEFKPERWLDSNGIFHPKSPFLFTAFMAGPRTCLGKDFAYMQLKIIIASLIYFFKFQCVEGKPVHYMPSLTLHMGGEGLNVHVVSRLDF